ncbi:MAG: LamG-like jellyroll fold domain-containing protein [Rhodopirellula sp. JB044]|uniref:LamG-like jellyroll fold domain-containing protein n=1 Tax=Rhodopirellula sp. JB044 TaxID=3342844 RepID=UPI00370A94DB
MSQKLQEEIIRLVEGSLHDELTQEESEELSRLVASSPDINQFYRACLWDATNIRTWAGGGLQSNEALAESDAVQSVSLPRAVWSVFDWHSHPLRLAYLAAAVLLGVCGGYWGTRFSPRSDADRGNVVSATPGPIARLVGVDLPEWEGFSPQIDTEINAGQKLVLKSGVAELLYNSGAEVVLQGPVEFWVGSQPGSVNSGYLKVGKLVARCETPESKGFTIRTEKSRVVDLGTRFGVEVQPSGELNVVVLTGVVELLSAESIEGRAADPIRLTDNQAATMDGEVGVVSLHDPDSHSHALSMRKLWQSRPRDQTEVALSAADLVAHWTFDGNAKDSVGARHGKVNGDVAFVPGRLGQAAAFDGDGDFIVMTADPLPRTDFTVAAWVLMDAISTTEAYIAGTQKSSEAGAFLRVEPNLTLMAKVLPNENMIIEAASSARKCVVGQWAHVAMTVSRVNGLKLYFNGGLVGSGDAGKSHVEAGNFTIGRRPDPVLVGGSYCYWSGKIDDVAVWDGALTAGELELVMRLGAGRFNELSATKKK